MRDPHVEILLAAYNGERFIAEQITSVLAQSHMDWRLLIRDDGSSDETREICARYARENPGRIILLEDGLGNLGLVRNFEQLLLRSSGTYVLFCDQDDVWLPDKIARELEFMQAAEDVHGAGFPLAVFSDAFVVAGDLRPISDSLLDYIRRRPRRREPLKTLAVEGNCYGCTMMLNRALVRRATPFPPGVISHDWWCGLVAAVFGRLIFADCALVKHRRHGSNQSATKENTLSRYVRHTPSLLRHRQWLNKVYEQCEAFASAYGPEMGKAQRRMFRDLALVRHSGWLKRRVLLARHGIRMTGFTRNVGFFLSA